MCQNLFTGRIVQNLVEMIILFVFLSHHEFKIRNDPLFVNFGLFRPGDPHFQEIR